MPIPLRRRIIDYSLLLFALGWGGFAVWALRQDWARGGEGNWLWLFLVVAGLIGGIALRRSESWLPEAQPVARPVACPNRRSRFAGYSFLMAAIVLSGLVVWKLWPAHLQWGGTVVPWLTSLLFAVVGGAVLRRVGQPAAADEMRVPGRSGRDAVDWIPRPLEVTIFLAIAALAIFLRVYQIDTIPGYIWGDETQGGIDGLNILEGGDISPFGIGWDEVPHGYGYYMAGLVTLLGANFFMLKAASVIPAILTVLAIYPLGRLLFGPLGALCAMLFMAVSRWHLTMSRWGWVEVMPPFFQVVATFFLVRGLRERRALDFVLGGLASGLMMYTYLSCRLVLATLVLVSLYWMALDPEGPTAGVRRHWRGVAIFFLAWAIVFSPLAVTYISQPGTFNARVDQLNVLNEVKQQGNLEPLAISVTRHLKAFHQEGDHNGRHNLPGEPQTDPVTGLLFVVGLGYGLLRLRDRRMGLLWFWWIFGMVGGGLQWHT